MGRMKERFTEVGIFASLIHFRMERQGLSQVALRRNFLFLKWILI